MDSARVVATLAPLVRPLRLQRMHRVLAARTGSVHVALENTLHVRSAVSACDALGIMNVSLVETYARDVESFAGGPTSLLSRSASRWLTIRHHTDAWNLLEHASAVGATLVHVAGAEGDDGAADQPSVDWTAQPRPLMLVVGNEERGVSLLLRRNSVCMHVPTTLGMSRGISAAVQLTAALMTLRSANRLGNGDLTAAQREAVLARWLINDVPSAHEYLRRAGVNVPDL